MKAFFYQFYLLFLRQGRPERAANELELKQSQETRRRRVQSSKFQTKREKERVEREREWFLLFIYLLKKKRFLKATERAR